MIKKLSCESFINLIHDNIKYYEYLISKRMQEKRNINPYELNKLYVLHDNINDIKNDFISCIEDTYGNIYLILKNDYGYLNLIIFSGNLVKWTKKENLYIRECLDLIFSSLQKKIEYNDLQVLIYDK